MNRYEIDFRDESERKMSDTSDTMTQQMELQDLESIATLGVGGFGR